MSTRCLVALLIASSAQAQDGAVAYRGATIETLGPGGTIQHATILIQEGKVQAVGADVAIPDTARVVPAAGKTIMPGLIDPYHAIRGTPRTGSGPPSGRRGGPPPRTVSFSRIADSLDPYDLRLEPLARSGISNVNLVTTGLGQAALLRVWPQLPDSVMISEDGIMFASVSNESNSLNALRGVLGGGSRAGVARGRGGPPAGAARGSARSSSSASAGQKLWQEVREGKRRLIVNANNSAAISHVLSIVRTNRTAKISLISAGPNVYETLDQIKQHPNISLILDPAIDFIPNSRDRVCVAREVHAAGIPFALSLSLSQNAFAASQDTPLVRVAFLVKAGLPREIALSALTTRPAELLGVEQSYGSLVAGKAANLLVFDGDPLDPRSHLELVLVEGKTVYESQRPH